MKIRWSIIIIGILVGGTAWLVVRNEDNRKNIIPAAPVKKDNILNEIRLSGQLMPQKKVEIKSRLSGILTELYVKVGDEINEGQPIGRVKIVVNPENLERAGLNVEKDRITLKRLEQEYNRRKRLFDKGIIAQEEFETTKADYLLQKRDLKSSIAQLEILQKGYENDNPEVSDRIVATASGIILELPLKEGASVTERNNLTDGTTVAVIADMGRFLFSSLVKETNYAKLRKNQIFDLQVGALPKEHFRAQVTLLYPQGREENGIVQFPIEAKVLANEHYKLLKAGYSATANVVVARMDSVPVIRERDIYFRHDSTFVEIVKGELKKEERYVKLGISDGVKVEVLDGVTVNEEVVSR